MKKILSMLCTLFLIILVVMGCSSTKDDSKTNDSDKEETSTSTSENYPIVTITMENGKEIKIELYPEVAPNTVANFVSLIEAKTYDGLIFHRVIPDFMIQGGDPLGNGLGDPGYSIKGEFSANKFVNTLAHTRGVISMARSQEFDSAGSQFFIMVNDAPSLDGKYASFGMVISGMETVDEIVAVERDSQDRPLIDQKIKTITVDLNGAKLQDLVKIAE